MHWFLDPIKNQYADFTGRTSRQAFWMYVLIYFLLYVAVSLVAQLIGTFALIVLFSLALLVPSVAITTRRLHDTDMSGWWQLLGLIPAVGWIIVIVLVARPGTAGANQFGPSPTSDHAAGAAVPEAPEAKDTPVAPAAPAATEENTQHGYDQQ